MSTEIAVRLDGITKRYGPVMALDGAGFQLRRGETVALLGPNGAGKTTTVGILLGLLRPDAGRLLPPRRPRATAQELEELAADAGTGDVPGSDQVVARLDPASRAREGQRVQLWFDPGKLHLFDPGNGAHLTR